MVEHNPARQAELLQERFLVLSLSTLELIKLCLDGVWIDALPIVPGRIISAVNGLYFSLHCPLIGSLLMTDVKKDE